MTTWQQRGPQLPRPLFEGITVYVELYKAPYEASRPHDISLLKEHGATISASHSHPSTTLIICSHPTSTAAPTPVITQQCSECPSVPDLVTLYGHERDLPRGKIILRREWIKDCLQRGVVLAGDSDWGGWAIRAGPRLTETQLPTLGSPQGQPRKRFVPSSGAEKPRAPTSSFTRNQQTRSHHSQHTLVDRQLVAAQENDGRHRKFISFRGEGDSVIRTLPLNSPTPGAAEKPTSPNCANSKENCAGAIHGRSVPSTPANTHGFSSSSTPSKTPSARFKASSDAWGSLVYPVPYYRKAVHEPRTTFRSDLEATSSFGMFSREAPATVICGYSAQQTGSTKPNQAHIHSTRPIAQPAKPDAGSPECDDRAAQYIVLSSKRTDDSFIGQTTSVSATKMMTPASDSDSAERVSEDHSNQSRPTVVMSVSSGNSLGIFTTATGPLGIWIDEMVPSAPSLSAMITRLGGGRMVSRESATHVLLALPPKACVTTPQQEMMRESIEQQPGRHVISVEWAVECFIQQRKVDEAAFTLNLADVKQMNMEMAKDPAESALSREEEEEFAKVFRIARSSADLHGALRVVANSLGNSLEFWQSYYECHKHRLDRICDVMAGATSRKPKGKRRREMENSEDSSESESAHKGFAFMKSGRKSARREEVSATSTLETPVTVTTHVAASFRMFPKPSGTSIVRSDTNKVDPVHLEGVNALKTHLQSWNEEMPIAEFVAQLPSPPTSLAWAEIYTTYRDVFRCLPQNDSGSKREKSPDSLVGSDSHELPLVESQSRTPSRSLYTAPRVTKHPVSPTFGKSYFTRSNLHTDRPGTSSLTPGPAAAPHARRKVSRERVTMMTEKEQRRFLWYIGVHQESFWREITDGWAAETTACMRSGSSYKSWVSRQGSQDVKAKAAKMTEATRRKGELVWDQNGTCHGCHGSSADLECRDKYELCVDCRILWDHAETIKSGKRAVGVRRGEVATWVAAQIEL